MQSQICLVQPDTRYMNDGVGPCDFMKLGGIFGTGLGLGLGLDNK